jgi:spore germination protein KC
MGISFLHYWLRLLTSIFLCLLLSGCWDRIELNQLGITSATAIDWNGKDWTVSYQIVIPQTISSQSMGGNAGQQAPVIVFSTSGDSIRGAIQKSSLEMPRALFFAHNRIVVIGAEAAKHGISQLMDTYLRNSESRETVSLFVTSGEGRRILEQVSPLEKLPGAAVRNMIHNEDKNSSNFNQVMVHNVMMGMTSDSSFTLIPEVIISGTGIRPDSSIAELKKTTSANKLKLGRLGIFKQDKLVGWFTSDEGYGINWIRDTINKTVLRIGCSKGSKDYKSAIRITKATTKLKPILTSDGQWVMKVEVNAAGVLIENGCNEDLSKLKGIKVTEDIANEEVTNLMTKAFQSAIEKKTDVFGFADVIHRKYPKVWKKIKNDWEEQFPTLQLEPSVHIKIDRIGMSNKPFNQLLHDQE